MARKFFITLLVCAVAALCYAAGWEGHKQHQAKFERPDPFAELAKPIRVELPREALPKNALAILVLGQSNAGNYGETRYTPHSTNVFSWYRGKLYRASDPLLGGDGVGGSMWCRLGDRLIDAGHCEAVVFIAATFGSSKIEDWDRDGGCFPSLVYSIRDARQAGLNISRVCWIQGETDASMRTPLLAYSKGLQNVIATVREEAGVNVAFYIAQSSSLKPGFGVRIIRKAQASLVNPDQKIFAGPDIDALRHEFLWNAHLSDEGLAHAAQAWETTLFPETKTPAKLNASAR